MVCHRHAIVNFFLVPHLPIRLAQNGLAKIAIHVTIIRDMRAPAKKCRQTTTRNLRRGKQGRVNVKGFKGYKKIKSATNLSPIDEWQRLSHVDAEAIAHMVTTPLRLNQAMLAAKERHAAIPQIG